MTRGGLNKLFHVNGRLQDAAWFRRDVCAFIYPFPFSITIDKSYTLLNIELALVTKCCLDQVLGACAADVVVHRPICHTRSRLDRNRSRQMQDYVAVRGEFAHLVLIEQVARSRFSAMLT